MYCESEKFVTRNNKELENKAKSEVGKFESFQLQAHVSFCNFIRETIVYTPNCVINNNHCTSVVLIHYFFYIE